MKRLFIFNPEHDLALANGNRHFIAPATSAKWIMTSYHSWDSSGGGNGVLVWGWDHAVKKK